MRLLFIASSFYSTVKGKKYINVRGGMEQYLYNLILRLKDKYEIMLLIPRKCNISIPDIEIFYYVKVKSSKLLFITYLSFLFSFIRVLLTRKIDLISQYLPNPSILLSFPLAKIFHIKTILNIRGKIVKSGKWHENIFFFLLNLTYFFTDYIIYNAYTLIEYYQTKSNFASQKYNHIRKKVIFNAIDSNKWKPNIEDNNNNKKYDICFIGNIYNSDRIETKGLNYLAQAINMIARKHNKDLTVNIIGQSSVPLIKQKIKNFNCKQFHFSGLITNTNEMIKSIQECKIFVLPSISEGMPNSLMESMSLGMPCISTVVGSVPNLIKNLNNGLLVEPKSSKDLAEKIWFLLNNPGLMKKIGKNARKQLKENFSWKSNVYYREQIYYDLIKCDR